MAEEQDRESKTEEATEKKIRDSLDKGRTPVAKEVTIFASFAAILAFTAFFAYDRAVALATFLSAFLEKPDEWTLSRDADAVALLHLVVIEVAKAVSVVMLLLLSAGVAASVLQNPPAFVIDRIQPKLSRISIKAGWTRIFGLNGFVEFAKALGKVSLAIVVLVLVLRHTDMLLLQGMITSPVALGATIRATLVQILVSITLVMTAIGTVDLLWSRFSWRRDLRMTRQEVKDEFKQSDGDPIVKARLRSLARDRARNRMIQAVPKATLVIANPTHFAIALRYLPDEDSAPVVVAKGQDLVALKIREIAEEHKIPVFENVALARSMYKQVSVDSVIPPQFYQAVAELIKIVFAKSASASQRRVST